MGLEVSRLARNNADWHRLLEICALADTLILDEDGVYDPDELQRPALARAQGHDERGRAPRAQGHGCAAGSSTRCGAASIAVPCRPGFVYDEAGNVVARPRRADPGDDRLLLRDVRARRLRHARRSRYFATKGSAFPSRLRDATATVFRPLTASTAMRTLNNPRYAGAYAYGRRRYRRRGRRQEADPAKARIRDDWLACIPNAHPGYITWERYQENLQILETNGRRIRTGARSRRRAKGRRCCKDARCAGDAADTSACDMPRGAAGWRPGTSATVRTAPRRAELPVDRRAAPSTKPSARWSPRR